MIKMSKIYILTGAVGLHTQIELEKKDGTIVDMKGNKIAE